MLQRTPTYFAAGRNADSLADELRKLYVDDAWIHEIMRRKVVRDRADLLERAQAAPDKLKKLREALPRQTPSPAALTAGRLTMHYKA